VHLTITIPTQLLHSECGPCYTETVFENTVRRVNKCLETGGGHFEHYL